jgi:hypothetical protein
MVSGMLGSKAMAPGCFQASSLSLTCAIAQQGLLGEKHAIFSLRLYRDSNGARNDRKKTAPLRDDVKLVFGCWDA